MIASIFLYTLSILTLSWLVFNVGPTNSQQYECRDAYACYGEAINYSINTINCWGTFACSNASVIQQEWYIRCWGSYSCYEASLVEYSGSHPDRGIECRGLYACGNNDLMTSFGTVQCIAELSCFNATIYFNVNETAAQQRDLDTLGYLTCWGDRSCENGIIYSYSNLSDPFLLDANDSDSSLARAFYMYGHLAGKDVTFMNVDTNGEYYFYGNHAGY